MEQKIIFRYDIIRIIACFIIVLTHANKIDLSFTEINNIITYITSPGIGLFFMISGALIISKPINLFSFLRKRFIKIGLPLVIWKIIYFLLLIVNNFLNFNINVEGNGILWFLFALFGLYLLTPVIQPWLLKASKEELTLILIIWSITLLFPLLNIFTNYGESIKITFNYFSGYIGFYILGFFLSKYKLSSLFLTILSFTAIILINYNNPLINENFDNLFWEPSIFTVSLTIIYWNVLTKISIGLEEKINNILISDLSKLTFGIYLIHYLIERELLLKYSFISNFSNIYIKTILLAFTSFIFSAIIVKILKRIPYLRILVGFNP